MKKLLVALAALMWLTAGAAAQQESGTATTQVVVTPNASAYTSGYCLGGVLPVPAMIRPGGPGGMILIGTTIVDTTGTNAAIDLLVFNKAPTGTYTDHAACTVAAGDQPYLQGTVSNTIFSCMLDSAGTTGACQATPALPITASQMMLSITPNGAVTANTGNGVLNSNTIWVVPVVRATPTYGSAKKLYFNFKGYPD